MGLVPRPGSELGGSLQDQRWGSIPTLSVYAWHCLLSKRSIVDSLPHPDQLWAYCRLTDNFASNQKKFKTK